MPNTPTYLLPYPLATDPANVPLDMQELAEASEAALNGFDTRVDATEAFGARITAEETKSVDFDTRLKTIEPKVPANRIAAGADGQVLTTVAGVPAWAAGAAGSGGELGYAQRTANLNITATTEATAQEVVAAPAIVFDGTAVYIEFFAPLMQLPAAANAFMDCALFQDGGSIGLISRCGNSGSASMITPVSLKRRISPSAGSHVFSIRSYVSTGTGAFTTAAGGAPGSVQPVFIRIVRA